MERTIVRTAQAPAAIGPYSQAVVVPIGSGKMIFCSGQVALVPETGQLLEGDVAAQTRQTLENVQAVLAAAGADLANIVKTTIFLASMDDFATVNAVYGERFGSGPPARSTVEVARLPRDAKIEIEVIAVV